VIAIKQARFYADAGGSTRNTQIGWHGSQAPHQAFDFQAWIAEVQQQAEIQAGGLEIIDALKAMGLVQRFDGLQCNQNRVVHPQVYEILADHRILVSDGGTVLLRDREPRLAQFKHHGILIDLFEEPGPERVV
jgi:hypothetical protein